MIDSILCEVGSWLLVKKEFENFSLNDFLKDWGTCILPSLRLATIYHNAWVPTNFGKLKINFDGASFGNPRPIAYGCVFRDLQGIITLAKGGGPIGVVDVLVVELMGLLEALRVLKQKELVDCLMEGDSRMVISWVEGRAKGSWRLLHLIIEAWHILKDRKAYLSHIPRAQNVLVDKLANGVLTSRMFL